MTGPGQDSGGGGGRKDGSWAQFLGSTLPSRLNKNVLEIVLDKDARGAFNVSDEECYKVMKKIGLDPLLGTQVEGVQICPNGRGVILITLKEGVQIDKFCRYDVLEVTESGIRAVNVKPAGKREVVVTVKGLHPNTRDQGVIEYLNKFGRVVTTKVVYALYGDGPLKGLKNGDRAFKVEMKPDSNIGSYHILDGNKVTVRYPGQKQTCARCHEVSTYCPGGGMARKCEAAGGIKVELGQYIVELWKKIGYTPGLLEFAAAHDDHGDDVDQVNVGSPHHGTDFTPVKVVTQPEKFAGVTVKQFPKGVDSGEIMEFLVRSGLPEGDKESVTIKSNGYVTISNLENRVCRILIESIHNKKYFERKLFCNGIIPLTPEKKDSDTSPTVANSNSCLVASNTCSEDQGLSGQTPLASPATQAPTLASLGRDPPGQTPLARTSCQGSLSAQSQACQVSQEAAYSAGTVPPALSVISSPSPLVSCFPHNPDAQPSPLVIEEQSKTDDEFVRRHSLSLRTPPPGSLAQELLVSSQSFLKTKNLLDEMKSVSDVLSDFNSCLSSISASSNEEDSNQEKGESVFSPQVGRKKKKKKRKHSATPPDKNFFLKKQNAGKSPESQKL